MRLVLLLISALLVTGCGAAMAEQQPAAETGTARIVASWDGEPTEGVFDLVNDVGISGETILAVDGVYEPIEIQPTGSRGKRWLKSPREAWDPFLLAPLVYSPQDLLALLETAERGEAVWGGEERGDPVTYYAATLRLDAFLATLTPAERADVSDYYADWEGLAFQLAVDEHERLRKAEFAFGDGEELVIELFDYGVLVDARAPDPSTVLTWQEYAKLLEAECERAKKEGRQNEVPHCASCGAGEEEREEAA
jgi:hypothetical protein